MARRDNTQALYDKVRKDYQELKAVKKHGVQKLHDGYILKELSVRYFKSTATIENIIFHRGEYK